MLVPRRSRKPFPRIQHRSRSTPASAQYSLGKRSSSACRSIALREFLSFPNNWFFVSNLILSRSQRLPTASTEERDEASALTDASNSSTLLVAELATVANALSGQASVSLLRAIPIRTMLTLFSPQTLAADTLVKIARQASSIPFTDLVPVHQLASWPDLKSKGALKLLYSSAI